MDLPTFILQWKERPLSQWLSAGNRYLPQAASALLVIGIAYQAAKLTWTVIPSAPVSDAPPTLPAPAARGTTAESPSGLDLRPVLDAHLFGEAAQTGPAPVVETLVDAPDTTLNLTLTGVVSSEDSSDGWAIIDAGRGDANTYYVGDTIENTGGTVLHAVYDDRVLLNRAGRLETLRLPKELSGRVAAARPRQAAQISQANRASLQGVLTRNASQLSEVIRVAPYLEQGQMVGFRLNPAQNPELFQSLGLQPNDVVTDINGMALSDPSAGLQVFESLGEATQASVTVLRNGTPEVLVIDTTQLQQLSEGRQ
ncbi:MAG: type II secretion system protein GspC [Gammaproteobacteria bacterium]|nr:type II secretion system protein GspC [Gammaproteobacteria bacterium]